LHRQPPKPRSKGDVREGLRYVRSMPVLWISFGMLAIIGTLSYNFNVTLPLFVTRSLHSTEGVFTILYSIFSFGAVVSALAVAHRGIVGMRYIIFGACALGITMLLLASVSGVAAAIPIVFLVGMSSSLYLTTTTAIVQVEAKPEMHGRVLAVQTVLQIGTAPIGGPISGWLADMLGARTPIILGGMACLLAAALGSYAVRHYCKLPASEEC
ncbi:MAG TPA: MFS transporter, partial [Armatimonadota bacterium]|nr:MFS transporter [Armatimonadota bacterium]